MPPKKYYKTFMLKIQDSILKMFTSFCSSDMDVKIRVNKDEKLTNDFFFLLN